jgi:hypothetical protein
MLTPVDSKHACILSNSEEAERAFELDNCPPPTPKKKKEREKERKRKKTNSSCIWYHFQKREV